MSTINQRVVTRVLVLWHRKIVKTWINHDLFTFDRGSFGPVQPIKGACCRHVIYDLIFCNTMLMFAYKFYVSSTVQGSAKTRQASELRFGLALISVLRDSNVVMGVLLFYRKHYSSTRQNLNPSTDWGQRRHASFCRQDQHPCHNLWRSAQLERLGTSYLSVTCLHTFFHSHDESRNEKRCLLYNIIII